MPASVRLIASERSIEPAPTFEVVEPIFTRLAGFAPERILGNWVSSPKKLVRLALSEFVRLRDVVSESFAASAIEMSMVMMSPTWLARGSWKKLRDPGVHNEFA